MVMDALYEFVESQDVDTDCIEDEMEIFEEEKKCNLLDALRGDEELMETVKEYLRKQQILKQSFSTGLPLFYWKWYRNATQQDVRESAYGYLSRMDLGGHSVQELSVDAVYDNLKEEVLATGLITPELFEVMVVQKAADYLKSDKCRKIKSTPFGIDWRDPLHYDIPGGSPLSPQHIQAVILYTDFTELCTLFSQSTRELAFGDGLKEIKARNGKFFHFSKYLREMVNYFGSRGSGLMNGRVNGPFYSGVSVVLNVSEFSIAFNSPTSTTQTMEVALRFAGSNGMILTVNNDDMSSRQPLLNASWISCYAEEDEYLFFGSFYKLKMQNISIIDSARTYRKSISALYLFDGLLTGSLDGVKMSEKEKEILIFCIKYALNEELPSRPKQVDQFVMDNIYVFTQKKIKIDLKLRDLEKFDVSLQNMLFHGVSETRNIPDDNSNIPRDLVFRLFPNLEEVVLRTSTFGCYPLNLMSLLSVMTEWNTLPSFTLKISDRDRKWVERVHDAESKTLVENFAAKKWKLEFDVKGGLAEDHWIIISKIVE